MAYGALGLAGAARLLRIPGLRLGLGLLGSAVLTALGALALRHAARTGGHAAPPAQVTSAPRAYLLALGATRGGRRCWPGHRVLRRRPGLRVWPTLRRGEAEMVAEIQHALGTDRFDRRFRPEPGSPSGTR